MKTISSGDLRVVRIIRKKKLYPGKMYRPSTFVLVCQEDDSVLLKHTLSKQIVALSKAEWAAFQRASISDPAVKALAKLRFLVEEEYDEVMHYLNTVTVLKTVEKKSSGLSHYTILPTTSCNARCFYCYEEGIKSVTMTDATANAVVDFIYRTKQEGQIQLDWFGGEPLCASKTISRICQLLHERGVAYVSHITTNAALFTPALIQEAVELWNLKSTQVSMDGAKADYEARKRYVHPKRGNYDTVMEMICLLSESGVAVSIRCNYDAENLPRLREFVDDCKARFQDCSNVSLYFAQLFQSTDSSDSASVYLQAESIQEYAKSLGIEHRNTQTKLLRTAYCMADSKKNPVIDPSGGLHVCTNDIDGTPIGTIFDQTPLVFPDDSIQISEECKHCPFLPDCTPFRKTHCPVIDRGCRTAMEMEAIRGMRDLYHHPKNNAEAEIEPTNC